MATIPLPNGRFTEVDEIDFPLVNKYKWRAHLTPDGWSVQAHGGRMNGRAPTVYLPRLIMSARPDEEVDHIDHNRLNNTRNNLRVCKRQQNNRNTRPRAGNKSGFKGVYWNKNIKRWHAQIYCGKKRHLGFYSTPIEAARAYDAAAREYFGEFAYVNLSEV